MNLSFRFCFCFALEGLFFLLKVRYVGKIGIVQMGTHMCILVRQLSGHIWALVIPHIVHQLHQMDQC